MTKKTKLIPFDWDKYKAGSKPFMKGVRVITIINSEMREEYPIHCIYEEDGESQCSCFTKNGIWLDGAGPENDLFLEVDLQEKTFYLNVYSGGIEPYRYESLENAQETVKKDNDFYQGTLKVTYTEEELIK